MDVTLTSRAEELLQIELGRDSSLLPAHVVELAMEAYVSRTRYANAIPGAPPSLKPTPVDELSE